MSKTVQTILVLIFLALGVWYFFGLERGSKSSARIPDLIEVSTPAQNESISSPLKIKGQARGYWFFEGSFPVVLTDWDGKIIAESYATAQGEWMTENFVPFEATVEFEKPKYGNNGTIILKKDNPSGLPENDDALEFNIFFE